MEEFGKEKVGFFFILWRKEKVVNIALMEKEDVPREKFQTELVSLSFVF